MGSPRSNGLHPSPSSRDRKPGGQPLRYSGGNVPSVPAYNEGGIPLLSTIEQTRLALSQTTAATKKSQFSQFLTPETTATFMASLFPQAQGDCHLLDAGAGIGSLSHAFLQRWVAGDFDCQRVRVDAFELDPTLIEPLTQTLAPYQNPRDFTARIYPEDFIDAAIEFLEGGLFARKFEPYTHAILNPPYKKIHRQSRHRLALRRVGIETVNLYSAFVALGIALMAPGGQMVAIIPRSFCNGPYYRPFRDFILAQTAIRHLHLFHSRRQAFKDDKVLQENIILYLERGGEQGEISVSTSTDDRFSDLVIHRHPFDRIVFPHDPERFIHIPTTIAPSSIELSPAIRHTSGEIGVAISTGPVVDFRLKSHLRPMPEPGTAPLIYPSHLSKMGVIWPIEKLKKPNAIVHNSETEKWLYPTGFYCVVRRFSSKEEKRRVVARVIDPSVFGRSSVLGFENHLNVFHQNRQGLPEPLARGLAVFLNSTAVDEYFRRFNGHTQVNATDLKQMKYPSRDTLIQLGHWAKPQGCLTQDQIDTQIRTLWP